MSTAAQEPEPAGSPLDEDRTSLLSIIGSAADPCEYDTPLERALELVASHPDTALVDLDETLYLSNSTEDFINLAVPGMLAVMVMRVLDLMAPWRWSGGEVTRDIWRVWVIRLLFPWTMLRWREHVGALADRFSNRPLVAALCRRTGASVIVTVGFAPIVNPLIASLGIKNMRVVASRLDTFADRRLGKLTMAVNALGRDDVQRAVVLSDSMHDLPLFAACALPLRVIWPEARYRPALSNVYIPGQYISRIKRPGERYFRRAVLQEDFAYWLLTSVALAAMPLTHVLGMFLLLLSFWTIYERGYIDNDLMALTRESDPKLSAAFFETPVATPAIQPWIWASLLAVAGLFVLRRPAFPPYADFLRWGAVLAGTYGWFLFYNRSPKSIRIWLFSVLQLSRAAAFTVLVPILPIGGAMLGAHVLARWMPYHLYRLHGKHWPDGAQVGIIRLMFFLLLAILLIATGGVAQVSNWTTLALLVWTLLRASYDLRRPRGPPP